MSYYTNAKQTIPQTFQDIEEVDKQIADLRAQPVTHWEDVLALKRLRELRADLTRTAEELLKWNKDKGNSR